MPFHLDCTEPSSLLYELEDGRFQFMDGTVTAPLMVGFQYVLASYDLCDFLEPLELDRVEYAPAILWNRSRNEETRTHKRLKIGQFFTSDQINDLNLDGPRLLTMDDSSLFVSPALKELLEASGFECLRFSEGLSWFAADAT